MSTSRHDPAPRVEHADSLWARYSPTTRHGFCLGLLLVVTLLFFSPVLFGGQAIQGTDAVSYRANAEAMVEYEERTGQEALWAPNVFGGMPAFMIGYDVAVPQLDTVVNTLRPVAFPASHFFVLLVGMYLLVFYLTRNHFSGLLSALAYAPYVLLAFVYTLRNPSLLGGLLFAGALALDLRAKHPQITYYVLMLALVWWIVEAVQAWKRDEVAPFAKSTGWLALGTGLALLMVAQPYLAIYQYKQFRPLDSGVFEGNNRFLGRIRTGYYQASIGPSQLDPDLQVININYDRPENPRIMRGLTDEVRFIDEHTLLGRGVYKAGANSKPRVIFWFTVSR